MNHANINANANKKFVNVLDVAQKLLCTQFYVIKIYL